MILKLLDALKKVTEEIISRQPLPSGKKVNVYTGDFPKITQDNRNIKDEPFVVIKPTNGVSDGSETILGVMFFIGTKNDEENEWSEPVYLAENIVSEIVKVNIIDSLYTLQGEAEWSFYESDSYPKWFVGIEMSFNMPGVFSTYGL